MADIKLFELTSDGPSELSGGSMVIEKQLQAMIEKFSDDFLGVRFLASEHSTGHTHGGRIDTLGIDENNCPVIIEYKRSRDENVISQGLYYLDWLLDHMAEFEQLATKVLGLPDIEVNWNAPRLLCIAGDFTKFDAHAVRQINRNIELIRYRHYAERYLILFEQVSANVASEVKLGTAMAVPSAKTPYKLVTESVEAAPPQLRAVWDELERRLSAHGDDVQQKVLKYYVAYQRIKNFACAEIRPTVGTVLLFLRCPRHPTFSWMGSPEMSATSATSARVT